MYKNITSFFCFCMLWIKKYHHDLWMPFVTLSIVTPPSKLDHFIVDGQQECSVFYNALLVISLLFCPLMVMPSSYKRLVCRYSVFSCMYLILFIMPMVSLVGILILLGHLLLIHTDQLHKTSNIIAYILDMVPLLILLVGSMHAIYLRRKWLHQKVNSIRL